MNFMCHHIVHTQLGEDSLNSFLVITIIKCVKSVTDKQTNKQTDTNVEVRAVEGDSHAGESS